MSKKSYQEFKETEKSYQGESDNGHLSFLGQELHELERCIEYRKSIYYKKEANKYLIPMPESSESGVYTTFDFGDENGEVTYLTPKGVYSLRKLIREEKKVKRDAVGFYFTICTGLIGSIIGLVSVLAK
ncbi:hypothetical protein [Vibrio parahaemolyticus]|uniref:hypothetical protein n=1 Tax=Vibrio parahaemolyticus TaxID=670 RepID=UPI0011B6A009|nr:hypothetical protein [Vibrio parahaemolyticus]